MPKLRFNGPPFKVLRGLEGSLAIFGISPVAPDMLQGRNGR